MTNERKGGGEKQEKGSKEQEARREKQGGGVAGELGFGKLRFIGRKFLDFPETWGMMLRSEWVAVGRRLVVRR